MFKLNVTNSSQRQAPELNYAEPSTPTPHGRVPIFPLHKLDRCIGVCIGYESGMRRGAHEVITLTVKLSKGSFGARPGVLGLFRGEIDTRCAVLQNRIVLDRKLQKGK